MFFNTKYSLKGYRLISLFLQASAKNMEINKGSFRVLFTKKGNLKCMYYSIGLILFQQMSGINVITFYSQSIFEESGSTFSPNLSAIIVAIFMTCTAVLVILAAKAYAVKTLLTYSAVGEVIGLVSDRIRKLFANFDNYANFRVEIFGQFQSRMEMLPNTTKSPIMLLFFSLL